jgi:hypothetical protein
MRKHVPPSRRLEFPGSPPRAIAGDDGVGRFFEFRRVRRLRAEVDVRLFQLPERFALDVASGPIYKTAFFSERARGQPMIELSEDRGREAEEEEKKKRAEMAFHEIG